MKLIVAVKKYMEADGGRKVGVAEIREFKAACSDGDRAEFTEQLCELGYDVEDDA